MKTVYNGLHVSVNLERGVYVFYPDSGTGKSYLASIFRDLSAGKLRVAAYTYTDYALGIPIDIILDNAKFDTVVLDRYDMYYGVGVESIVAFGEKGTVLVDCKQTPPFPHEMCTVMFYNSTLEVSEF